MKLARSPLAPQSFPELGTVAGVHFWCVESNIRYKDRTDLAIMAVDPGSTFAAVLTQSACCSAAVDHSRAVLAESIGRAIIVNSGNANAFTGKLGVEGNDALAQLAAEFIGCDQKQVFTASTGVIGEPLPLGRLTAVKDKLHTLEECALSDVAEAIRTTDTFAKGAKTTVTIDGTIVHIEGVAKGSGMIAPNMATMLAFIFTDANIEQIPLQQALVDANRLSFNSITVDSDTSTSDTCILAATRKANHAVIKNTQDDHYQIFYDGLKDVLLDLAQQVVADGEGAQKFITVNVRGAVSDDSARVVAFSIANSPLVKTAIAGEDANWGRIVMAVGKAGEPANRDTLSVAMGGVIIAEKGEAVTDYVEERVNDHLRGSNIVIDVNLNLANGKATVYTCDLTHGYIDINADYRS